MIRKRLGEGTRVFLDALSLVNLAVITLCGLAAFLLINPELDSGPVRVSSYVMFFAAGILMSRKHLSIVRSSPDGKASIYIVASTYFWLTFTLATAFIAYLVAARALGFAPLMSEALQLRISYYFISGSAAGALFTAVVFNLLPTRVLIQHRIPAWPLTAWMRRRIRAAAEAAEEVIEGSDDQK